MPDFDHLLVGYSGAFLVLYAVVPLFPLLYVIVRWRTAGRGEPGVGLEAALLYFRSVALLVCLTGISIILHSLVAKDMGRSGTEDMQRAAGALLVAGGVSFLLNALLAATVYQGDVRSSIERVFHGFVLILSGIAAFAALLIVCFIAFQEHSEFDDLHEPLVWVAVWTATYLVHIRLLQPKPGGGPAS